MVKHLNYLFWSFVMCSMSYSIYAQEVMHNFKKTESLGGIEAYSYTPNGMKLLLVQDRSAPVVTVQIVYEVGSKHEVTGNTGATHLLEHLMFKGTPTFNKRNGNAVFTLLQGMGARLNATTWNDRTNYYETIPSDKIETAIHIEADRMRNALLLKEDKEAEMTVVRNEFERGENNSNRVLNKEIWATAYMAHPYHHSTIGWRSDIENMDIETLRDFYNTYYWPDNATLTIIGDFEKDKLFKLVDKYFGKITKAPHNIPQPYTKEPEQLGPRRVIVKKPGQQAIVTIGYKIPGMLHNDLPALSVLAEIIGSGTSSMINKSFVDTGMALNGQARASKFRDTGLFTISLRFTPDKSHESINTEMLAMVEKLKKEGVLQTDVDRVISKLNAQTILSRDGSGSIAGQLNSAIAGGDWKDYITGIERLSKVTAADVQRVARTYFKEDQSTTGYFVPQIPGSNQEKGMKSVQWLPDDNKYYYRTPNSDEINVSGFETSKDIFSGYESIKDSKKSTQFERKQVSGIDIVSVKTGAKDFITVTASFPIAGYLKTQNNREVPGLTTQILNKGTTKHDKFTFSEKLEKLGVSLRVNASTYTVDISFKSLKKDVNTVMTLLAEELRYPLFDLKEFELLKTQRINRLKQSITDPGAQGIITLLQTIYPKGHPNYKTDIQTAIKNVEAVTLDDLKAFHRTYFGPAGMHLVAVGDVDSKQLYASVKHAFKGWKGGVTTKTTFSELKKGNAVTKVVTIPKKPSANMYIGQYTGIERKDKDFIPFYIGTHILGGGFSGRLMQTVRDRDGLTYGIYARHSGHINAGGFWSVNATFNPSLFQKGLEASMVQIKTWVKNGITEKELAICKTSLTGSFKVGMSTTSGLANTILKVIERGLDPSYIEQYPKDIEAVTLDQVNAAITKYIDLEKLIVIKAGSLDENGPVLE